MTTRLLTLTTLAAALTLTACGNKDDSGSTDGTDGADGADGADGTADGADGTADGADGTADGADGTDGTEVENAAIRVIHLGPDVPAVDVHVNGGADPVVPGLEFLGGTAYLDVPEGTYDFQVSLEGDGPENAALVVEGLPLEGKTSYTAAAIGSLADGNLQVKALVDAEDDIADGSFRVQVVHGAAAVGEVDIWNITDPSNPSPLVPDFPFAGAVTADLPAGAYNVGIDVDNDESPDVTFNLPELPAGLFVNLFAVNDATGAVWLVAQLPDGTVVPIPSN